MNHKPVLVNKVIEVLKPRKGESFADFTAGYGGHASALLNLVGERGKGYLFDKDPAAITALKEKFANNANISIEKKDFSMLNSSDIKAVDMVLLDLGVSSPQLDEA